MVYSKNNFPVDIVYTWVDGSDEKWITKKNKSLKKYKNIATNEEISGKGRFTNRNELKYSLRSVDKFAKWIRNIYIITDNQRPKWLNCEHPKINIIDHTEIFNNKNLPSFNSHAIEMRMHYIKNLSENFLSLNDDLFFGRKCNYKDFFINDKTPKLFTTKKIKIFRKKNLLKLKDRVSIKKNPHHNGILNARTIIFQKFNKIINYNVQHGIKALNKSVIFELEKEFTTAFKTTTNNHFRDFSDTWIMPLNAFYLIATNRNKPFYIGPYRRNLFRYNLKFLRRYRDFVFIPLSITRKRLISKFEAINKYKPLMFCVNDGANIDKENSVIAIKKLKKMFSEKSEFEK